MLAFRFSFQWQNKSCKERFDMFIKYDYAYCMVNVNSMQTGICWQRMILGKIWEGGIDLISSYHWLENVIFR